MFNENLGNEFEELTGTGNIGESEKELPYSIENDEVILKTGKRIKIKEKTGAHHMVENRLMAVCVPRASEKDDMGVNMGDMVALGDIRAVVSIAAINGKPKKMPKNLGEVFELMAEFVYNNDVDEWSDFKLAVTPNKEKIEEMAKNLQGKAGSETESVLPIAAERE